MDLLLKNKSFEKGEGLHIMYHFVSKNEGSRFARWFTGGIGNCGEAKIIAKVVFKDSAGKELGSIFSEGRIGSGFFGGSSDSAVKKMAEETASFTINQFAY